MKDTEGNCGGPGAVAPGKFLIFEVTQPYFFVLKIFLMQKRCGRSIIIPNNLHKQAQLFFKLAERKREKRDLERGETETERKRLRERE